jgi:hypothetical protein
MASNTSIAPALTSHKKFADVPPGPLRRQTNSWDVYSGQYPEYCATTVTEENISHMLDTAYRHVAQVNVDSDRGIMHHVARITAQLDKVAVEYQKDISRISIGTNSLLQFFFCRDSKMFHVLLLNYENAPFDKKLNQIVLCLRVLLQDNDFMDALPEITFEAWEENLHMTIEPDIQDVFPQFDDQLDEQSDYQSDDQSIESTPEWFQEGKSWDFPFIPATPIPYITESLETIGEPDYCARIISQPELEQLKSTCFQVFDKKLESDPRSEIVTMVIRVTAQLEQLKFRFQKISNTRQYDEIVISFYVCNSVFYVFTYTCRKVVPLINIVIADILASNRTLYYTMPIVPTFDFKDETEDYEKPFGIQCISLEVGYND